ncbi:E3 ubiquitin-protein ligase TRIM56-like isoform X2 [Watersipora subatra]|uniref:E3 ubiquitin-protein ligase TRIM56-like isoform X2 n=1 Tax=Watersipora subatra TaxID=2589382 RepID=UPI00355B0CE8
MTQAVYEVSCGFCFRKVDAVRDLKVLPCSHMHCQDCLTSYYEINQQVICGAPACGEVFAISPAKLSSFVPKETTSRCDACLTESNSAEESAISRCSDCLQDMCRKHLELHDETMGHHHKVTLEEYKNVEIAKRNCIEHTEQAYMMGCKVCRSLQCQSCLPQLNSCTDGGAHTLLPLEELVSTLLNTRVTGKMVAEEVKYEELFKKASKLRAEFDAETVAMRDSIHQTKNAQIRELEMKYAEMEVELLKRREKTRMSLINFQEEVVLENWWRLQNQRRMLESRVKHTPLARVHCLE